MRILVLDNYDSFTFNLVHYIEEILDQKVDVYRNDEVQLDEVDNYDTIILSPGPGIPEEAGIMPELIKKYANKKAILGVCLGHQAIGEAFGGQLENLEQVYHGIETAVEITENGDPIYQGIPKRFQAGRYHSWVINKASLPGDLEITAKDDLGQIMSIRHKQYPIWGLQYHPESIMTEQGKAILKNFFIACS